jgi:hypothetical protein
MKIPTTVSIYGLVPVPSNLQMQALRDEDQPPIADDANVALLAWYRHLQTERLATKDEIARVREALQELDGAPQTPIEPVAAEEGAGALIASAHDSPLPLAGSS